MLQGRLLAGVGIASLLAACGGEPGPAAESPRRPAEGQTVQGPREPAAGGEASHASSSAASASTTSLSTDEPVLAAPVPRHGSARWLGAAVYPSARSLCEQRIRADGTHIAWEGYASPDPITAVRAFYEQHRGEARLVPDASGSGFRLELDAQRSIRIIETSAPHPSCGVEPGPSDRTYFVVSTTTR
jgi:hypothetical protein